jgi:hypothetical protein
VDLDESDRRRVALLALLVGLGLVTILISRTAGWWGLNPTTAAYGSLIAGAVLWTGIMWVVISRGSS